MVWCVSHIVFTPFVLVSSNHGLEQGGVVMDAVVLTDFGMMLVMGLHQPHNGHECVPQFR